MKNIFVIIGKSGCGKSTLVEKVCNRLELSSVIITTTRPKRDNEIDGIDYIFLTDEEFQERIAFDEFVQCTHFRGWGYGIEKESLNTCTSENIITVLSPKSFMAFASNISNEKYKVIPIYIQCDNKTRLQRSLIRDNDVDEIVRRYQADNTDFEGMIEFIVNAGGEVINNSFESLDCALDCLERVIKERSKILCK